MLADMSPYDICTSKRENISMFILAISPILNLYMFMGTPILCSQIAIVFAIIINHRKLLVAFHDINIWYILSWLFVSLHLLLFIHPFKVSYLLPGGINYFLYSIGWIFLAKVIQLDRFNKVVNYVFYFCAILFVLQLIVYNFSGKAISVLLPISEKLNYGDFTFSQLTIHQATRFQGRFSSVFAEPSYWAQYCLFALCLELFSPHNYRKLYTPTSICMVIILLFSRSGVGILCLAIIILLKIIQIVYIEKDKSKQTFLVVMMPIIVCLIIAYLQSDAAQEMLEKGNAISTEQGEGNNSAYMRLFFGWDYIEYMDINELLLGSFSLVPLSAGGESFFNCFTYYIVSHGLIAMIFLIIFYVKLCRSSVFVSVSMSMLLLSISLMEAIYLTPIMLMATTVIAASNRKDITYDNIN